MTMRALLYAGTILAAASSGTAHAQVVAKLPEGSSETSVDEIVVTAFRRTEALQNVPASISAIGGEALVKSRIVGPSDLMGSVPNLQAVNTSGEGTPIFSLRGISMSDFSLNQQGPVATYFDDVYAGSFTLLPIGLYDLERVEVLRGPQGTLYGKNTTGGAINFISRAPKLGKTEGSLSAGYGNYDRREAQGTLNLPLSETLAIRGAFTVARADGWFRNVVPGRKDGNATRQYAVRVSVLFQPSDELKFTLRASTSLDNPVPYGIFGRPLAGGAGAGLYAAPYFRTGLGRREQASDFVGQYRHRTNSIALTTNWDMSQVLSLTAITAYSDGKLAIGEDVDGSPLQIIHNDATSKGDQFTQELRLASDFSEGPNFIAGAYYGLEKQHIGYDYRYMNDLDVDGDGSLTAADCAVGFFAGCIFKNEFRQTKKNIAFYSDANWPVTDALIVRGGLRYTHDNGRLSGFSAQVFGADRTPIANLVPGDPFDFDATTGLQFEKDMLTGKLGVDFKVDDEKLLYASFSRGYRASAFNAQALFSPDELNVAAPETVNAYEAGFKTQFFDRSVTFNGAVFHYAYRNQQALSSNQVTNLQNLYNIPRSRILGAEFELSARLGRHVRFNAGVGLLDTKIERGNISGNDISGNQLPGAPKFNANVGVDADILDNESGKLTIGVEGNYSTKRYFELYNIDRIAQGDYAIFGGRLSYRTDDDKYGASLWAKNIFNKYYVNAAIDISTFGFDYFHLGAPREYGITLDAKF